ncbi:hypothetical protein HDU96_009995 [Phlyctochytrium bullatum]|nr:hypothetical protein HDU96_009995 [Phlyctochytrium bullatum]
MSSYPGYDTGPQLPYGWASAWDPSHQRYYFVAPDGTTTWNDPRYPPAPDAYLSSSYPTTHHDNPFADHHAPTTFTHPRTLDNRPLPPRSTLHHPPPTASPPRPHRVGTSYVAPPPVSSASHYASPAMAAAAPASVEARRGVRTKKRTSVLLASTEWSEMGLAADASAGGYDDEAAPLIERNKGDEARRGALKTKKAVASPGTAGELTSGSDKGGRGPKPKKKLTFRESTLVPPKPIPAPSALESQSGDPLHPKSRRYCLGLFRTRSGCRRFWILFFIFGVGGMAVTLFFLFPRYPTVVVSDPTFPEGVQVFNTFGRLATASTENPFVMQINMEVKISVWSGNYWDIRMDRLTFDGTMLDMEQQPVDSAKASGTATSVTFKQMENTTFTLPLALRYSITRPTASLASLLASDSAVSTFAMSCGIVDPTRKSNLQLDYTAKVYISLISWLGLVPEQKGKVGFPCPVPPNAFEAIVKTLK